MQKRTSMMICAFALAITASADVRNIRPPTTGEGKIGTTTYKWGEVHAEDGYYSNLILGGLNITNKFLSPYDGAAGEVFYANGLGGGVWGAASSPTNGISQSVAESLFASIEQGETADAALPRDGSAPMLGDLDLDGYDIVDAGTIDAEIISMDRGRTLIGGKTIGAIAATNTRRLVATNNALYVAVPTPSQWVSNDYVVVLSATLATNYFKIDSINQCTNAATPISTLNVGDYYLTATYTGSDVPEESAITACGVVVLRFSSTEIYRGFTLSYQAGFGYGGSGEFCDIRAGVIRPGVSANPGVLASLFTYEANSIPIAGSDDGYYAEIISYCTRSSTYGFDPSINFSTTFGGPASYNPQVTVFPNH